MATKVIKYLETATYDKEARDAAAALRAGALVAFPTETVYGVGANAALPEAMARLRDLKSRADTQPFTVHIGHPGHALRFLTEPSILFRRLARKLWPGPLTLICEERRPEETAIGRSIPPTQLKEVFHQGTVGLRCPDHPAAAALLSAEDVPVVASSANLRDQPPPLDAEEVLRALDGRIDLLLDAGRTRHGAASTVVELRGHEWRIQRSGALDERQISRAAISEVVFVCTGNSCRSPLAEYLFRRELADRLGVPVGELETLGFRVSSAGTHSYPGAPASTGSLDELSRRGIDASGHRSQPLSVEQIQRAERIYTMTAEHRAAVLALAPGAANRVELLDSDQPIADPIGGSAEDYRRCADQIAVAVARRVQELLDEDRNR